MAVKPVQYLNKPAHMCAFEEVGQIYIHVDRANGPLKLVLLVQNRDRIRNAFYPDLFNVDSAVVGLILNIFHKVLIPYPPQEMCRLTAAFNSSRFADFTM